MVQVGSGLFRWVLGRPLDLLEQVFDYGSVETLEYWWNGALDVPERGECWLRFNPAGLWEVEVRQANRSVVGEYPTETQAQRMLAPLKAARGWRRIA
jgi:hypothetical protein